MVRVRKYTVYVHIFPNGKRYVGITGQSVNHRWQNGKGYIGQPVYNAICKYGWHNIEHRVLYEDITKDEAESYEKELILEWKTSNRQYGYNIEKGGNLNKTISAETKYKISAKNKGQIPWIKGKHHTEYSKELNRLKHLGKPAWNKGIKFSEESKSKMSESKKLLYANGWLPTNAKKVICLETGVVYDSAREAARALNIVNSHISSCCTGKRKSVGGFHFQYYKEVM